jgi:hypothetical protein
LKNITCFPEDEFEPITPALEPLKEWSDDLMGKRVVCIKSEEGAQHILQTGQHYTIASRFQEGQSIMIEQEKDLTIASRFQEGQSIMIEQEKDLVHGIGPHFITRFALAPPSRGKRRGRSLFQNIVPLIVHCT